DPIDMAVELNDKGLVHGQVVAGLVAVLFQQSEEFAGVANNPSGCLLLLIADGGIDPAAGAMEKGLAPDMAHIHGGLACFALSAGNEPEDCTGIWSSGVGRNPASQRGTRRNRTL